MKPTIWTIDMIREEMQKLDRRFHLNGAELPIQFNKSKNVLGCFSTRDGESFTFSTFYFHDPDWPYEEAVDVIRHEYAHYMNYEVYGQYGHKAGWKKCCIQVGARPERLYTDRYAKLWRERHAIEDLYTELQTCYAPGTKINHPMYSVGVITAVSGEGKNSRLTVDFSSVGSKKLNLPWVEQNCRIVS